MDYFIEEKLRFKLDFNENKNNPIIKIFALIKPESDIIYFTDEYLSEDGYYIDTYHWSFLEKNPETLTLIFGFGLPEVFNQFNLTQDQNKNLLTWIKDRIEDNLKNKHEHVYTKFICENHLFKIDDLLISNDIINKFNSDENAFEYFSGLSSKNIKIIDRCPDTDFSY